MRDRKHFLTMIEIVADALEELLPDFVFIGGATLPIHIDDPAVSGFRPTVDVDCIVEIATMSARYKLEELLRAKGFVHPYSPDDNTICRWRCQGIPVDIMPTSESILGFTNIWYQAGFANAIPYCLPSGKAIKIFSLPYILASKFEAYKNRGVRDPLLSHDLEDIVAVIDGRKNILDETTSFPIEIRNYFSAEFAKLLSKNGIRDVLSGFLDPGPTNNFRLERVVSFMRLFSAKQL